jgi:hypothetical protein
MAEVTTPGGVDAQERRDEQGSDVAMRGSRRTRAGPPWRRSVENSDSAEGPVPVQETGLRLDPAQDHTAPAEVELRLVADQDRLKRDDALAGGRRLDEQPPIE